MSPLLIHFSSQGYWLNLQYSYFLWQTQRKQENEQPSIKTYGTIHKLFKLKTLPNGLLFISPQCFHQHNSKRWMTFSFGSNQWHSCPEQEDVLRPTSTDTTATYYNLMVRFFYSTTRRSFYSFEGELAASRQARCALLFCRGQLLNNSSADCQRRRGKHAKGKRLTQLAVRRERPERAMW